MLELADLNGFLRLRADRCLGGLAARLPGIVAIKLPAYGRVRSRDDLDFVNTFGTGYIAGGRRQAHRGSTGARCGRLKVPRRARPNGYPEGIDQAEDGKGGVRSLRGREPVSISDLKMVSVSGRPRTGHTQVPPHGASGREGGV